MMSPKGDDVVKKRLEKININVKPVPRTESLQKFAGRLPPFHVIEVNWKSEAAKYLLAYFDAHRTTLESPTLNVQNVAETGLFGKVRVGKVLRRLGIDATDFVRKIRVEPILSVRYNDILRCSITEHFYTCFCPDGSSRKVPAEYLTSPAVGICFVKDKSGKFSSRVFVYALEDGTFFLGRPFGELLKSEWIKILINHGMKIRVEPHYGCEKIEYIKVIGGKARFSYDDYDTPSKSTIKCSEVLSIPLAVEVVEELAEELE